MEAAPVFTREDDLEIVVMPIGRSRFLYGWHDQLPEIGPELVLRGSILASEDFFVAHPMAQNLVQFVDQIGAGRLAMISGIEDEIRKE